MNYHPIGHPICPKCRIQIMWPSGHAWQCPDCGLTKLPHENDPALVDWDAIDLEDL